MKLYIVTKSVMTLEDGEYDNKKRPIYKRKTEQFEIIEKAFISYIKAAKYIRELLIKEDKQWGGIFSEEDMNKWDTFFIGFHHGCTVYYEIDPVLLEYCKRKGVPPPSHLVTYKIETVGVDYEILDETKEILKGLA